MPEGIRHDDPRPVQKARLGAVHCPITFDITFDMHQPFVPHGPDDTRFDDLPVLVSAAARAAKPGKTARAAGRSGSAS